MLSVKQNFSYNMNRTSKMGARVKNKCFLESGLSGRMFIEKNNLQIVLQWTDFLEKFSWYI